MGPIPYFSRTGYAPLRVKNVTTTLTMQISNTFADKFKNPFSFCVLENIYISVYSRYL